MSRASSGRSSRTGLGKSTTVPPFGGGAAGFGVTGSGARGDAGGCGALGSGLRAGASGSLRARSGVWAICGVAAEVIPTIALLPEHRRSTPPAVSAQRVG